MIAVVFQDFDDYALHTLNVLEDKVGHMLFQETAAVEPGGFGGVIGAVLHETHQPRKIHLAVLRGQKPFQIVVSKRGIFDVNLADYANLHLGRPADGNGGELPRDDGHSAFHLPAGPALVLVNPAANSIQPFLLQTGRVPLADLIGFRLGL